MMNPLPVTSVMQPIGSNVGYGEITLCADPNCPVCRAQRGEKRHKRYRHRHRRHRRKPRRNFWSDFLRTESPDSVISVYSIDYDDRRRVTPIERHEERIVETTRDRRVYDDDVREAWVDEPPVNDELVCCQAYDSCPCPCWCCIVLIVLFVILIIVLIVLLATLL